MNNDLISREALREDLRSFFPSEVLEGIEPKTLFAQIMHDIDNAPTVEMPNWYKVYEDVKSTFERPQGEWIKKTFEFPVFSGEGDFLIPDIKIAYECSKCNTHWDYTSNFCPNCGADMRPKTHIRPKDEDDTWKDDMQRDADAYFESGGEP